MRGIRASALTFDSVRAEFDLPAAFPDAVEREAAEARDAFAADRRDARDLPLVTIDPPGARDLDQAVHVQRTADGFRLHYAIADVGAFVRPGSTLHTEAMHRGQTVYLPDGNVPLHPRSLSEDRASLLPDVDRPCVLWTIDTDDSGDAHAFTVERATVRSRAQLDYASVQAAIDAGDELPDALLALPEFGAARQRLALARGAIELQLPSQDLERRDDGWNLRLEPRTTVDSWNAECSLLTGQCAARLMVDGGVGLLRTLPAPDDDVLREFRGVAAALGVDWPIGLAPGAFLAGLPRHDVRTLALMSAATKLLRGSGYLVFGASDTPRPPAEDRVHGGVAAEYAHATAPLRRLADRFSSEICLAVAADRAVDADLLAALDDVPARMSESSRIANSVSNACLNTAEAVALRDRVGETFDGAVLRPATEQRDAEIFVLDPPVIAGCTGHPPLGTPLRVRLETADPDARTVTFSWTASPQV